MLFPRAVSVRAIFRIVQVEAARQMDQSAQRVQLDIIHRPLLHLCAIPALLPLPNAKNVAMRLAAPDALSALLEVSVQFVTQVTLGQLVLYASQDTTLMLGSVRLAY